MIVFTKLWETMEEKGVTTYMLREQYNVDSRTIRRLRANQNVTTNTLNRLCRILDCGLDQIAGYEPDVTTAEQI
ncbi:helix-turn-helix domain-containing protein [Candidatus Soleaferrea massiliensis]|uniref:helix-turn-helix domain-containing protein n=1 Tax=Candidatus Soleaferrea massiliensis TaxID=1470354 RepID=UPI00058F46A5|nr:helix-turn-helix transcriptional regulator [Candidatus Soleaferrea massiliensis]